MNNLVKRTISGVIFIAVVAGSILLSSYTFAVVFMVITALAINEFHKLTNKEGEIEVNIYSSIIGAVLLFCCSFVYASDLFKYPIYSFYGFYMAAVMIAELYRKKSNPLHNWAYFILGQIFIALPFSLLNFILFVKGYQPIILLAVFLSIWLNDTGAYTTGMLLGKHKLFERISPKKTWEGFIGGAVFALLSGFIFSRFIPELNIWQWLIFTEIIVIFGTFGDLIESLMKRTEKVKDSGNILPGHGGILDRFDSMLMVAPMVFIFLSLIF